MSQAMTVVGGTSRGNRNHRSTDLRTGRVDPCRPLVSYGRRLFREQAPRESESQASMCEVLRTVTAGCEGAR